MSFTIRISTRDLASPEMERLAGILGDQLALDRAAVEGAVPLYQRRFVELASTNTNPFGVGSSFWRRMLASTKSGADSAGGFIRMPREVALRAFGGVVKAKKSKFLAIAARSESYGKSPRQFNDLRFVPRRGRPGGMLVQNDQTQLVRFSRGKSKGQVKERREVGGLVMYWLVPQVTVQGSDAVLPVPHDVGAAGNAWSGDVDQREDEAEMRGGRLRTEDGGPSDEVAIHLEERRVVISRHVAVLIYAELQEQLGQSCGCPRVGSMYDAPELSPKTFRQDDRIYRIRRGAERARPDVLANRSDGADADLAVRGEGGQPLPVDARTCIQPS